MEKRKYLGYYHLNETSINRIMKHGEHGFVILSACRSEIDNGKPECLLEDEYNQWLQENDKTDDDDSKVEFLKQRTQICDKMLEKDIRNMGFAYSKVYGGYHPNNMDQPDKFEPSYIVYNHERNDESFFGDFIALEAFAMKMCQKYRQDSVYIQHPNELPVYMNSNGDIIGKAENNVVKINRDDEVYFTTVNRSKKFPQKFSVNMSFLESFRTNGPSSLFDRRRRTYFGEIFLLS